MSEDGRRNAEIAAQALECLELNALGRAVMEADVERACARAQTPHGDVAAVCVPPAFVAHAKSLLGRTRIGVATVANYPDGREAVEPVEDAIRRALNDGVDEIAVVMPYRAFAEGRADAASRLLDRARRAAKSRLLKVIVETGMMRERGLIRRACDLAIDEGADLIQTSTGAVEENATPEAAALVMEAIAANWRPTGLSVAGPLATLADARAYLRIAAEAMGRDWVGPKTVRLVTADLLGAIVTALDAAADDADDGETPQSG
jgi:deoxyribose-phosphate aldolase